MQVAWSIEIVTSLFKCLHHFFNNFVKEHGWKLRMKDWTKLKLNLQENKFKELMRKWPNKTTTISTLTIILAEPHVHNQHFTGKKVNICSRATGAHLAVAYPSSCSIAWLGVLPLPPGWEASSLQVTRQHYVRLSWQFDSIPFHSGWREVRRKICSGTQHNDQATSPTQPDPLIYSSVH